MRAVRGLKWAMVAAAALLAAASFLSLVRPVWAGRGGVVVGVTAGRLEVARSDGDLARQGNAWAISCPAGMASILIGPQSAWRPTSNAARVTLGTTALSLRVVYVPLWPLLTASVAAAGLLWWRVRGLVLPGHCASCGYDLKGLAGGTCPECGAGSRAFRAVLALCRGCLRVPSAWLLRGRPA